MTNKKQSAIEESLERFREKFCGNHMDDTLSKINADNCVLCGHDHFDGAENPQLLEDFLSKELALAEQRGREEERKNNIDLLMEESKKMGKAITGQSNLDWARGHIKLGIDESINIISKKGNQTLDK